MQTFIQGALFEFRSSINYIRIRNNNLCAEVPKLGRLDGLDIGVYNGHDGRRLHCAVRGLKAPDAAGAVFVEELENWGHDGAMIGWTSILG